MRSAVAAGLTDLAENYAQALRGRVEAFAGVAGLRWHFVGALQRNKAGVVAAHADVFHALDRIPIAEALSARREGQPLECYVEVNIAGEDTKVGVEPVDVGPLLDEVAGLDGLRVVGLMCMPPPAAHPEDSRRHFAALRELGTRHGLKGLSMGTSDDFEVAIEEGATVVRVGEAIFGLRPQATPV